VDRLNRSLTGLSAQVCPRRPVRAGLSAAPFFSRAASFLTGRFLSAGGLACRFFCLFSVRSQSGMQRVRAPCSIFWSPLCSSVSARIFLSGQHPAGRAAIFFLFLIDRSLPLLGAQIIIFFSACCRSAASVRATFLFFLFVLSGHFSSAGRVQNFFWTLLLSPRAMLQTFSLCSVTSPHSHACVSGAPAIFFLSSRFRSTAAARTVFFCHSLLFL
jgi:hypothetical protein